MLTSIYEIKQQEFKYLKTELPFNSTMPALTTDKARQSAMSLFGVSILEFTRGEESGGKGA